MHACSCAVFTLSSCCTWPTPSLLLLLPGWMEPPTLHYKQMDGCAEEVISFLLPTCPAPTIFGTRTRRLLHSQL